MAYVNNGTERSLKVTVYKKVGGNYVQGYPKTYDGQLSWGNPSFPTLTDTQARQLSDADYSARLLAFKLYVENIEPGVSFSADVVGDGAIRTNTGVCLPTTTTTKQPVWSFTVKYAESLILPSACQGIVSVAYAKKQFPGVGDMLYSDAALSVPWARGGVVLITSPAIYGTKQILVAVVNTAQYDIGEIIDTQNGYDCSQLSVTTTTVAPVETTTTTSNKTKYYLMYRCNGESCYLPEYVKTAYEYIHGEISHGDRFYGAILGNSDYLYTYVGTLYESATAPSCVINGITRTTDSCP